MATVCCWMMAKDPGELLALKDESNQYSLTHMLDAESKFVHHDGMSVPSLTACGLPILNPHEVRKRYDKYKKWGKPSRNFANIHCGACIHNVRAGTVAYQG